MKLDNKKTITVGFAFLAISAFWQVYDNIIPLILKYFFEIGDTASGAIMALDNIFALIMLPIFGAWSDKINHRRGKRTPFIFVGTILAVIFMLLLPAAANGRNLIFFIAALLMTLVSMSIFRSPAVSLMPDVTLVTFGRGVVLVTETGMDTEIGKIASLMNATKEKKTPLQVSLDQFSSKLAAVIMVISLLVILFMVDENKMVAERIETEKKWGISDDDEDEEGSGGKLPKDVKKSLIFLLLSVAFWYMAYNAVTTAFSKYAIQMWGMEGGSFAGALMVASVGALVSFIPVGIISSRLGRKRVILFGVALLAASFLAGAMFKEPNFAINIMFFLVGVAWAAINVNSYPMVVEMCKGSDIGKFTGMYYTFSMAAQVLTPVLSGLFLEHVGYWTLFPYAAAFSAVAFCTMLAVKHGDSKPSPPKSSLEAFDVDD